MTGHAEARERLELAAAEPGGLDRLMAGDTAEAAAIAGHLAGCPECTEEFARLRRTATILREVVATEASIELPADLKARTLAYVAELGVPRQRLAIGEPAGPSAPTAKDPASSRMPIGPALRRRPFRPTPAWFASIAAAIVLSVVATTLVAGTRDRDEAAGLAQVASWTAKIAAAPDARQIGLFAAGGESAGSLAFAPTAGGLVVLATHLTPAPSGSEYRCWLETSAGRTRIGKMYVAQGISYWAGGVGGLWNVQPGTRFGVSLESTSGNQVIGEPVLVGTL